MLFFAKVDTWNEEKKGKEEEEGKEAVLRGWTQEEDEKEKLEKVKDVLHGWKVNI